MATRADLEPKPDDSPVPPDIPDESEPVKAITYPNRMKTWNWSSVADPGLE